MKIAPLLPYFILCCLSLGVLSAAAQLRADFSIDKNGGCSPLTVSCTNKTTGASPNASYKWDLDNGNISVLKDAGAIYTEEKTYTITLTVQDGGQSSTATQQVTVYHPPTVDFSVTSAKVCLPSIVIFNSSSTAGSGSISTYSWDFGDGATLSNSSSTAQHAYSGPIQPTISLTVTNNYGCAATLQKQNIVQVFPALTAAFTADKTILCNITDAVQLANTSTGPGTLSYQWDFGDGGRSTQYSPSHLFGKKGIYTVKLTATSSEGCVVVDSQANYVNVATYSTDFTVPALICDNSSAVFNMTASPNPNNTTWTVDNNSFYYYGSPFYYAFTPGTHTIAVTNTFGTCTQTVTKTVTGYKSPVISPFTISTINLCGPPATYQFTDNSTDAVKWEWDFNYSYGNPNPTVYTKTATYTYGQGYYEYVFLGITNSAGCTATEFQPLNMTIPYLSIGYLNSTGLGLNGCTGMTITFNTYTGGTLSNYQWNFGDGSTSTDASPTHTYTKAGNYTVTLTATDQNGCKLTAASQPVEVVDRPNVHIVSSIGTTICGNTPLTLTLAGGTGDYNYWNFGDGQYDDGEWNNTVYHQYLRPGDYTISVVYTTGQGCVDTLTETSFLHVLSSFTHISQASNTCDGQRNIVTFNDTSYEANSWSWNFGDGSSPQTYTTATRPVSVPHTYPATGAYKVVLTTTNGTCAVKDSMTTYVLMKQHPVLSSPMSSVCSNGPLTLNVSGYQTSPYIDYAYDNDYFLQKLQYGDSSIFLGYSTYSYGWQNNSTFSLTNLDITKKDLLLISYSGYFGCADTSNLIPVTFLGVTAGFKVTSDKNCYNSPVVLQDTSKVTAGDKIISWSWDFGDGNTLNNQGGATSHLYASPGSYYVKLSVADNTGCQSSTNAYLTYVSAYGPKAAFTASATNVQLATTVSFYNSTNAYGDYFPVYTWNFGDNSSLSNDYSPSHTYNTPGTYMVTLTVSDATAGCSSTMTQTIVVNNFNSAFSTTTRFVAVNSCPPVIASFTNTSLNYTSVSWDFGDGITAGNVNNPSHIYQEPGKYIVTLTVTGYNGLVKQYIDSVIVQQPAAIFASSPAEICIGQSDKLHATTADTVNYTWDFGDGSVGVALKDSIITHVYATAGKYAPALLVTGKSGCITASGSTASLTVRSNPTIVVSPAQPFICQQGSVALNASGGSTYVWSPADGLDRTDIASPQASPLITTAYQLLVTDDIGCQNNTTVKVTVQQPEAVSLTGDTAICKGDVFQLHATGADNYSWTGNIDGLDNTQTGSPIAGPDATITYTVAGSDKYACFTDTKMVTVKVMAVPSVNAGPDQSVLAGETVALDATGSADVIQWRWAPADYLSCTNCAQPESSPIRDLQYIVTVKNQDGCLARDTVILKTICDETRVSIPNAFTPNGDGVNDIFIIKGISIVKHLVIFSRMGMKVFERNNFLAADHSACWNGTINGNPAPTDTYVYFAEMQCPSGGTFTRKGTVVLVR